MVLQCLVMNIIEGYSYDDILVEPKYSEIDSRNDVKLTSNVTKHETKIAVNFANTDTITEDKMATKMALMGGIGIIHVFVIEDQVNTVKKVKRHVNYEILNPM